MSFSASPLAREPRLLWRKVAKRLGHLPQPGPREAPAHLSLQLPAAWRDALRSWFSACAVAAPVPAAEHVFGRTWPRELLLELAHRGPRRAADLTGDIKLGWDFARSHHAPLRAFVEGPACAPDLAREMTELMQAPAASPFWSCAMDVSIRAVNWLAADALCEGALGRTVGAERWAGWMWQHLDVTWRHLEAFRISSNHYLANLLGLTVLGRALPDDSLAHTALAFARREWPRALLTQTNEDGGLNEASLRYHGFVTEMALLARLFDPVPWPEVALQRLEAMCGIVAGHADAAGELRSVGDDDSGRVFAVDHASPHGRVAPLLALAKQVLGHAIEAANPALHQASGWWSAQAGDWRAHFEFGGVGLAGEGAHAHDDDLAVCLDFQGRPVLGDPGSYLYTSDRVARDIFRSAFVHTTVRLLPQGETPAPLHAENCFVWRGRNTPLPVRTRERGIAATNGSVQRELTLDESGLRVTDMIAASDGLSAWWFFHLHPDIRYTATSDGAELVTGDTRLRLRLEPPMVLSAQSAGFSERYGTRTASTVLRGCVDAGAGLSVTWRVTL